MRWRKYLGWGVALTVIGGLAVVAAMPRPVEVDRAQVERGAMTVTVGGFGSTRVKSRHTVYAPLAGRVDRITLQAGDTIQRGQSVATIHPLPPPLLDARSRAEGQARVASASAAKAEALAAVGRAKAASDKAKRELERVRKLADSGAVSQQALDDAKFESEQREREVAAADLALRSADQSIAVARAAFAPAPSSLLPPVQVASPADGRVLRVLTANEGPVAPATPLVEIGDPLDLEVVVDLLTVDAVRVRSGAGVAIDQYGAPAPLRGTVRRVEPSAFTKVSALGVEEQRVNVVIDPDGDRNAWAALGDGYRVETRIVVWQSSSAVRVPVSALFRLTGAWHVFTIDAASKARLRAVQVGQRNGFEAEVLEGLNPGDQVIVHAGDRVQDGVRVAPAPLPSAPASQQ